MVLVFLECGRETWDLVFTLCGSNWHWNRQTGNRFDFLWKFKLEIRAILGQNSWLKSKIAYLVNFQISISGQNSCRKSKIASKLRMSEKRQRWKMIMLICWIFLTHTFCESEFIAKTHHSSYTFFSYTFFSGNFSLDIEGGERGPPLPEMVRSSYRRLQ